MQVIDRNLARKHLIQDKDSGLKFLKKVQQCEEFSTLLTFSIGKL